MAHGGSMTITGREAAAVHRLNEHVRAHGKNATGQRALVLVVMMRMNRPATIDQVKTEARKIYKHIGYATVYRALNFLVTAKLATKKGKLPFVFTLVRKKL